LEGTTSKSKLEGVYIILTTTLDIDILSASIFYNDHGGRFVIFCGGKIMGNVTQTPIGPLKIFGLTTSKDFTKDVCLKANSYVGDSETVRFKNGQLLVKYGESVRGCDVFIISTAAEVSTLKDANDFSVNDAFIELLWAVDTCVSASAARVTVVMPYNFYTRSDKKDKPRINIGAQLAARLLEEAGANRILTMDLHSPQGQGFFRIPVDQLSGANALCDALRALYDKDSTVLVAGDAGEAKELGRFANRLNMPMAVVDKRREGDDDTAIATNVIGDVEGKHAIIVDDEIATGGTICEASRFLLSRGATGTSVAATHGVLCGPAMQRLGKSTFDRVIITDTVPLFNKRMLLPPERQRLIQVVSVAGLFAEAIGKIHRGGSMGDLF
jgi:ribose-phosphate pyrophosphokinase